MPSNHLILCRPLILPSIFLSIGVFSNEAAFHIRWPKYWSFSFNISPSNEYSGLISFRMDWLDLLAVQGTLKSLLQHHSSEASILWCSTIFMIQLSHPYMTTGKTIALTRWTFVDKVMSLLFKKVKSICLITTLVYQGPYKHTICVPFKFQKLRGWHVIISNRDFNHDMHHNSIFSHTPLLICTVAIILGQTEK